MDIRDNICPTFMIWGICHRRHRCNLRHPSYRYLERPQQKAPSPEPVNEEPKPREPNSYAAVLAKNKPPEPEKFFVDLRSDLMTKNSSEEEWPTLGSPEQGLTKAPKTWRSKRDSNVLEVWESTTLQGPCILDEKSKATADQLENERLFAENLQDSEYTQLTENDENDKDNYNPAAEQNEETYEENDEDNYSPAEQEEETYEDNDEDSYNPEEQGEETKEKNEISFDGHHDIELTHIEASRVLPKISRICDICMDRPKDATLVCGHRYYYQCALQMRLYERVCVICRRCIVSVIKTYN